MHFIASLDLTAESLNALLAEAERRKSHALADYERASAEVEWLKEGLRIIGASAEQEEVAPPVATEVFPSEEAMAAADIKPTLRQAIVITMRRRPAMHWTVKALTDAIVAQGWIDGPESSKRVSDMAAVMVSDNQLRRVARGTYVLSPVLAAGFELNRSGTTAALAQIAAAIAAVTKPGETS